MHDASSSPVSHLAALQRRLDAWLATHLDVVAEYGVYALVAGPGRTDREASVELQWRGETLRFPLAFDAEELPDLVRVLRMPTAYVRALKQLVPARESVFDRLDERGLADAVEAVLANNPALRAAELQERIPQRLSAWIQSHQALLHERGLDGASTGSTSTLTTNQHWIHLQSVFGRPIASLIIEHPRPDAVREDYDGRTSTTLTLDVSRFGQWRIQRHLATRRLAREDAAGALSLETALDDLARAIQDAMPALTLQHLTVLPVALSVGTLADRVAQWATVVQGTEAARRSALRIQADDRATSAPSDADNGDGGNAAAVMPGLWRRLHRRHSGCTGGPKDVGRPTWKSRWRRNSR